MASPLLKGLLKEQRENALERLLRCDDDDLAAKREAVLTLTNFEVTLNERIKRAVGDDSAA